MYQTSRSFFDLCPRSLIFYIFQAAFDMKPLGRQKSIFRSLLETRERQGIQIYHNSRGLITKMAVMPIYGENL